jgi:NitT/TauT family transport system substrate-binding protein
MRRSTFARTLGVAGTSLTATSLFPFRTKAAVAPISLRLGALLLDGAAEPFYAQDMGFFEEAGLDVKLTISTVGGSALLAAVVSKQLDICAGSTAPLILARERGVKVRYFHPGSIFVGPVPNSALMVAKDSPIRTVADIAGKTIAVAAVKDLTQYCVQAWIAAGGGNPDGVRYVEIPYSAMVPALVQGRVDAICQSEPFVTTAKSAARVLASLDDQIGRRYYLSGWLVTDDWPAENMEAGSRFVKAMQRAAKWANTHRTESAAILVKYTKIDPNIVAVMKRNFYDEGNRPDPRLVQDPLNMMIKYGGVSSKLTPADLVWSPERST